MPLFSKELVKTLRQALSEECLRGHRRPTLERLLLALTDDVDATSVLEESGCDVGRLQQTTRQYIDSELKILMSDPSEEAKASEAFERVVQRAVYNVQSSGGKMVTGANILVTLFTEKGAHAAYLLRQEGLTRFD